MIPIAYAETQYSIKTLFGKLISLFINPFIVFLTALAALLFIWGLFQFLSKADNEEGRAIGKQHMTWGLVGLLIMVSAYGIMSLITGTFGFKKPPEEIKISDPKSVTGEGKPYDFQKK